MGNLKERIAALLALILNVVPLFVRVKRWMRPYWKFIIFTVIILFAIRYLAATITVPTSLPKIPTVPISFIFLLLASGVFLLAFSSFGYVMFTFLALVVKINQVLAADVRGVAALANKVEAANPSVPGTVYTYDEFVQAGIEEQQKQKREHRMADEEFDNFVKANAGDLHADMNGSGLP